MDMGIKHNMQNQHKTPKNELQVRLLELNHTCNKMNLPPYVNKGGWGKMAASDKLTYMFDLLDTQLAEIRQISVVYEKAFVADPRPAFRAFVEFNCSVSLHHLVLSFVFFLPEQFYVSVVQFVAQSCDHEGNSFGAPFKSAEPARESKCKSLRIRVVNDFDFMSSVQFPIPPCQAPLSQKPKSFFRWLIYTPTSGP